MPKSPPKHLWKNAFIVLFSTLSSICLAGDSDQTATNSFPTPAEVFQGRQFANKLERDIFFLRAIHDQYPPQWPALLDANITVDDYIQAPDKLLRFINELTLAMRNRNDPAAAAHLALVTSTPDFFANTNAYHPEIVQAAAEALIDIGPAGHKALASSFTQEHYRTDAGSLEDLAKIIAKERPADPELAKALAGTAFDFSTANGGTYPRCTSEMVKDLLALPDGPSAVIAHLNADEVLHDPARFQSVIDGIAAARTAELATNLTALEPGIKTKLDTLTNSPGAYRDDLQDLSVRIRKTLVTFKNSSQTPTKQ
jgi:hypothetical protein